MCIGGLNVCRDMTPLFSVLYSHYLHSRRVKAYTQMVILRFKLGEFAAAKEAHQHVLGLVDSVTTNESTESINRCIVYAVFVFVSD